jgi:hypothetical protein
MTAPQQDQDTLGAMLARLRGIVAGLGQSPKDLGPISLSFRDSSGRGHRIVLLQPDSLLHARDLTLVGFFGQRRKEVSAAPLYSIDSELIDELRDHCGIVSYSSLELSPEDSANLVLATDRDALDHWQRSAKHAYVSRELAPRLYTTVRIHTGSVPGGLPSTSAAQIVSTRALSFLAA